jgi:hypothetical protein
MDLDNVRVLEPSKDSGLLQVGLDILGAGEPLRVGHFDRHEAVEIVVTGKIDSSEASLAETPDYPVAPNFTWIAARVI